MSGVVAVDPEPNLPLIRRVVQQIDEHPETWDQTEFAWVTDCGTTYCFAGHAVAMTEGVEPHPLRPRWILPASRRDWVDAARDHLGLTYFEAQDLFINTIRGISSTSAMTPKQSPRERVQTVCEEIAARAGETL